MIDMPTYGVTQVRDRKSVTYDDWVEIGAALIDKELARDDRPIFLYGLSAGGMETYHVAVRNPKVKGIIGMTFLDQKAQIVRDKTSGHILMGRNWCSYVDPRKIFGLRSSSAAIVAYIAKKCQLLLMTRTCSKSL